MSLLEHIALAVDFSSPSEAAARAVFRLARIASARRVTLLHAERGVVRPREDVPRRDALEDLERRIGAAAKAQLEALAARCGAAGLPIDHRVVFGRPRDAIADAAREVGATLLALGTHQRTGLTRLIRGSIAEQILERAHLPTLLLHAEDGATEPAEALASLERVVIGVDRIDALPLVDGVAAFVESIGRKSATLVLVHAVISPHRLGEIELEGAAAALGALQDGLQAQAQSQLAALARSLEARGHRVETHVLLGEAAETILANARGAGLVVVGSHGLGRAPRLGIGTTAQEIVRAAEVSVLLVPNRPDDEDA
ncbi:MAG: universal stress protein [Deltaproteobacteria bacterium]|nr:universal stress protein [Deltaproteobacteria bacterium]